MAHIGRGGLVEVECLDGALAVVAGEVLQTALGTRAASYNQPETMMHISVANDPHNHNSQSRRRSLLGPSPS